LRRKEDFYFTEFSAIEHTRIDKIKSLNFFETLTINS
jgi:hypothetical protein